MAESTESTRTAAEASAPARQQSRADEGKHVHHGQTPAAWAGSTLAIVGFLLGGISLVTGPNWTLFVIAVILCVLAMVAGLVLQRLGYGAT